jgi:hypothetical protein
LSPFPAGKRKNRVVYRTTSWRSWLGTEPRF